MVAFVILSLALMSADHRYHYTDGMRSLMSLLVSPIYYLVDLPSSAGGWLGESFASRNQLQEENQLLLKQQTLLKARLLKYEALETENKRLRELMDASQRYSEKVMIAELLDVDIEPYSRKFVLARGGVHGVYVGQPVIDANGIMGQVAQVTPLTATVILITDPNHAIPVAVNRNGLLTIAMGSGRPGLLELPFLPYHADIQPGDLLISSGLGRRFPPGYPVAVVQAVKRDPREPYAKIVAKPTAKLESGQEVLLIWPKNMPAVPSACPANDPACAADQTTAGGAQHDPS